MLVNHEFTNECHMVVCCVQWGDGKIEKIETATLYKQVNPNLHFEQKFGGKTIQRGGYRHAIEEVYLGLIIL